MARRGASRGSNRGTPAIAWLFTGILIGLGLAWYLAARGYISAPAAEPAAMAESPSQRSGESLLKDQVIGDEDINDAGGRSRSRYDFFTVLPETEVVVPKQELSPRSDEQGAAVPTDDSDTYLLQVGSFQSAADADQLKAKLALMGIVAQVQSVAVNETTWHRVRIGPVQGARQADEIRRQLQTGGIDSLVMKNS